MLIKVFIIIATSLFCGGASIREARNQRCRTKDDLGRIPWFLPNTTFHNFGFPLIRSLCDLTAQQIQSSEMLRCDAARRLKYLHESERNLRTSDKSSTIIVDPYMMQDIKVASSGVYVILAMYEILLGLDYQPSVRHWSDSLNEMFPKHVAIAAMNISHRYEAFTSDKGDNPFATTLNHILLQIELPYRGAANIPVNSTPYGRTNKWVIGLHQSHTSLMYAGSDPTAHCIGANFFLGRGRMCSSSGVIPCPQYEFHRTRSLEVTPETRKTLKKNIILVDDDQLDINMALFKSDLMKLGGLDDLVILLSRGRKKAEMPDLYKQVKMTIDCRNPGVEFINYEATLYDVMTLACDLRTTRNVFDFPVPSQYHFNPRDWTQFIYLVHDSMVNYEDRIDDFKHFKRLSRSSSQMAKVQTDIHYFSRDVLFRTHCGSYAECRRVYPWAVAVWTLYPMAMIEVVTDVDIMQETLDNDLIRLALSDLFTTKYFKMFRSVSGLAPVDIFPRTPCAYMVYMDASFIPFGRDFLNTHVAALVKDPRPIVYWHEDKLVIAIQHARPYVKMHRVLRGARGTYLETDFEIRLVAGENVTHDLVKIYGFADRQETSYLSLLKNDTTFTRENFKELLLKNPPLSTECCIANIAQTYTSGHKPQHAKRENVHGLCAPRDDLIIDAIYVPMARQFNKTENSHAQHAAPPTLWLTSSVPPIPLRGIVNNFTQPQMETIVQHLDPIVQNANMQKISSLIPTDIADALRLFDAADYPDVISLRDMEYAHWGEECP